MNDGEEVEGQLLNGKSLPSVILSNQFVLGVQLMTERL